MDTNAALKASAARLEKQLKISKDVVKALQGSTTTLDERLKKARDRLAELEASVKRLEYEKREDVLQLRQMHAISDMFRIAVQTNYQLNPNINPGFSVRQVLVLCLDRVKVREEFRDLLEAPGQPPPLPQITELNDDEDEEEMKQADTEKEWEQDDHEKEPKQADREKEPKQATSTQPLTTLNTTMSSDSAPSTPKTNPRLHTFSSESPAKCRKKTKESWASSSGQELIVRPEVDTPEPDSSPPSMRKRSKSQPRATRAEVASLLAPSPTIYAAVDPRLSARARAPGNEASAPGPKPSPASRQDPVTPNGSGEAEKRTMVHRGKRQFNSILDKITREVEKKKKHPQEMTGESNPSTRHHKRSRVRASF